jgi:hypothetical protein
MGRNEKVTDRGIIRPSNIPFHMLSSPSSDPAGLHPQSFFHPPQKNHKNEKKDFDNEHIGGYNSPVHLFSMLLVVLL